MLLWPAEYKLVRAEFVWGFIFRFNLQICVLKSATAAEEVFTEQRQSFCLPQEHFSFALFPVVDGAVRWNTNHNGETIFSVH